MSKSARDPCARSWMNQLGISESNARNAVVENISNAMFSDCVPASCMFTYCAIVADTMSTL